MSRDIWKLLAALGTILSVLAVAPHLLGIGTITSTASIETAEPAMIEQIIRLFVGGVYELVPLTIGGMALFLLFQLAEARAV